jgi:hypothetical protein
MLMEQGYLTAEELSILPIEDAIRTARPTIPDLAVIAATTRSCMPHVLLVGSQTSANGR